MECVDRETRSRHRRCCTWILINSCAILRSNTCVLPADKNVSISLFLSWLSLDQIYFHPYYPIYVGTSDIINCLGVPRNKILVLKLDELLTNRSSISASYGLWYIVFVIETHIRSLACIISLYVSACAEYTRNLSDFRSNKLVLGTFRR